MNSFSRLIWRLCLILLTLSAHGEAAEVEFGRDIRPLLSDRCFHCHGPDRTEQQNDLRLDSQEFAQESVIVPGDPDKSELIIRILSDDPDLQMPPADSGRKPLTPEEVQLLKQWIQAGAQYQDHWAFSPPRKPPVPSGNSTSWGNGPIDAFVLERLGEQSLMPAAPADRRTLIRRLSFDLLGLPPSPEEVAAFEKDESPQAYERLVDRLLQNEHFGERMAIYWLDLVRYADTGGYHSDNAREVDAYRDYVIQAFNENLPFDQFTIEQLAGDLLPEPTIQQKIASGYNRMLQTTEEGGAQAKEYVAIYQADRVRNVSTVWMAITMGCCQCHDHKFDPFTMRDFYSLGAFFADVKEVPVGRQPANLSLPTPEQTARINELNQQITAARTQEIDPELLSSWATELRQRLQSTADVWTITKPVDLQSSAGTTLKTLDDQSVLASGKNPDHDIYTVAIPVSLEKVTGFRLEALTDPSLVNKSLSRANGNFVLTNVSVTLKTDEIAQEIKIASAKADFEQNGWPVAHAIDGNPQSGWAVDGHNQAVSRAASFTFAEPVNESPDAQLVITLAHESAHAKHNIGRFRLSVTSVQDPPPGGAVDLPTDLITVLMKTDDELLPADKSSLDRFYRELAAAHEPVRQRIAQWEKEQQAVQGSVRTTLITETTMPREVRILPRGNWLDDSGEVVRPAIPARLGTLNTGDRRATRLDLATWLVQPDHPLTSRVFVNRIWKLLFGNGLSRSLEDAGYQGEWPTHPELLDWMAVDFVDSGWDIKALIKQIVMSETYQQESAVSTEKRQRDPYNKWLARQSRFRLSAEMVRDNALKVSGLLVEDLGGPSVKPYQPDGYWQHLNFPARSWQHDTDDNQYRRGLYTFWCRSFLHPSLLAFDATSREECTAERPRSNTPLQALVLLNDPTYVEAARVLATKAFHSADSDSARIDWMTQRVLQRDPTSQERAILLELLRMELERYGSNPKLAQATVTNGMSPSPEHHQSEIATWTAIARTLLNLHETVTRE